MGITVSSILLCLFAAPGFAFGIYEKNGMFLEQKIKLWWNFQFKNPKKRLYIARNVSEHVFLFRERQALRRELRQGKGGKK